MTWSELRGERFITMIRNFRSQFMTDLHVLQELGAWESVEMVRRYAHLSADHLASYVDRAAGLRPVPVGEVATPGLQSAEMKTAS